ncbi:UNVERIFIED_CONTAM: hypothetical protein Sradi_5613300 [Sesamum radiatum]|uniref:Uncharacterized protein n=1 Tax=Sesamum radiatum TaxID=300843 RepID=A0AAW2KYW1_SESRA
MTIKAQVFADFLEEIACKQQQEIQDWLLHVDGSSNASKGSAWSFFQGPWGIKIEVAVKSSFQATNNEAKYETHIIGLNTTLDGGLRQLDAYIDSQLVPREENQQADALSKFGALISGVKEWKIAVVSKEITTIDEKDDIHVIEREASWKMKLIQYLKE